MAFIQTLSGKFFPKPSNLQRMRTFLKSSKTAAHAYTVCLEVGDKPSGACRGIVNIKLRGNGKEGYEEQLAVASFPDNFERGFKATFKVIEPKLDSVDELEIRGDTMIGEHGWKIDRCTVTNNETGIKSVFPVFTNIRSDQTYTFSVNGVSLPHTDSNKDTRTRELCEAKDQYELTQERLPGCPPLVKQIPRSEHYPYLLKEFSLVARMKALGIEAFLDEITTCEFETIDDIQNVFGLLFPKPSNLQRWKNDELFGMQRLIGVNPDVLTLCTSIPEKLAVSTKMVEPFLEDISLQEALQKKRIFIVDYEILDGLPTKPGFIMTSPIALFYQRKDDTLVPIAIQLFQKPGENNPVFLPSDPKYTWILAKMWFNVADSNYHESVTHLGFTHLKMEGIVAVTHRQIHKNHPIFKLLMPHFLHLLLINWIGMPALLDKGGYVVELLNIGREGLVELIKRKNKSWRMDIDGTLPNDLKERGLDDPSCLPDFYYRDDAIPLYNAILRYVQKYLDLYYASDKDIQNDEELQQWRNEMVRPVEQQGLGMLGVFGKDGKFTSKKQVCQTLTSIIFTCSVKHAAVNSRQYEEYAFPPNFPLTLRGCPPKTKEQLIEKDLLDYLPQKVATCDTLAIAYLLSTDEENKFGDFEFEYVTDPKALKVVKEFRDELEKIGMLNKGKNNKRKIEKYWSLHPNRVPNFIAI